MAHRNWLRSVQLDHDGPPWEQVTDACEYGRARGDRKASYVLVEVRDFDLLYRCLGPIGRQRVRSTTYVGEGLPIYIGCFDVSAGTILSEINDRWRDRVGPTA